MPLPRRRIRHDPVTREALADIAEMTRIADAIDAAVLHSHGYAWNRIEAGGLTENGGDPLWEVWGTYAHDFARESEG